MKVFEVTVEYDDNGKILNEVQYVTSEDGTIKSVTDYFVTHCEEYDKNLKCVREVLDIVEHIKCTDKI